LNQYEAMFLFDPTFGAQFENCEAEIRRLMERAGAEIIFCKKWDERRLAFKVKGRKRGLYVLVYFKGPSEKIAPLERDCQIAENILRVLILRAEGVTLDMMEKAVASHGADTGELQERKFTGEGPIEPDFAAFDDGPSHRGGFRNRGRRPANQSAKA